MTSAPRSSRCTPSPTPTPRSVPTRGIAALATVVAALTVGLPSAHAQSAAASWSGKDYHTRDPLACPAVRGAPSAAAAAQIFRCTYEMIPGWLLENVTVQIGVGRPAHEGYTDLDPSKPVYPIRGRFTRYSCTDVKQYPAATPGCTVDEMTFPAGLCYQTTFGDWRCKMENWTTRLVSQHTPGPQ